jgi:NhaP-type Na+/H+ or K+/H+ antiporter
MSMTGFSGSDDLLACFVAGNAFSWDEWFRRETEEAHFQEVIDTMLNLSIFVYIGSIIVSKARCCVESDFFNFLLCSLGGSLIIMSLDWSLGV